MTISKTMRHLVFAAIAGLAPTLALADADAILAEGAKLCAAENNGTFGSDGAVRNMDLTGDETLETVVDEGRFTCSTAADLFNPEGVSKIHLLVNGTETVIPVRGWDTANWSGNMLILLQLSGTECEAAADAPCFATVVWGGESFHSIRDLTQ